MITVCFYDYLCTILFLVSYYVYVSRIFVYAFVTYNKTLCYVMSCYLCRHNNVGPIIILIDLLQLFNVTYTGQTYCHYRVAGQIGEEPLLNRLRRMKIMELGWTHAEKK